MAQRALKKVVVFGGNGFVGSAVLKRLSALEQVQAVSISRSGEAPKHAAPKLFLALNANATARARRRSSVARTAAIREGEAPDSEEDGSASSSGSSDG